MKPILTTKRGASYCAEALSALRHLHDDGQRFAMTWIDGPYFMGKGEWDPRLSLDAAVEWYGPYLEAMTACSAPSASVYLWGTDELEAELRRSMRALGWTFRGRVTWDKGVGSLAGRVDTNSLRCWPDVTEACGFYQREAWQSSGGAGQEIAYAAGADDRNRARAFLCSEWAEAGLRVKDADAACGVACMASRHYFPADQWWLPTWEHYQNLATYAQQHGPKRDRPYLVLPEVWGRSEDVPRASWEVLRTEQELLRAEYDHLRASYDALRPAFTAPLGVTNVWRHNAVSGAERLRTPEGESHPCQKPFAFAERAVLASTRPGESVLDLFAGTHRIAVAVERMAEARRWVAVEQDPRWAGIVRRHLTWDAGADESRHQPSLFGRTA